MYNNPGKSLKRMLEVIVGIGMVCSVILGIATWVTTAQVGEPESAMIGFIVAIIVATVGCVLSWVFGLILATFADIGDNIFALRNKYAPETDSRRSTAGYSSVGNRIYTKMAGKNIEDYAHDKNRQWVCSSCMTVNDLDAKCCSNCGCEVALK